MSRLEPRGPTKIGDPEVGATLATMSNPWRSIPLADYEGHMGSAHVQQLGALSALFKRALDVCAPESVAVLGVAGGNGLEHVNRPTMRRIVGVDINAQYLDEVRRRFGSHSNLELLCADVSEDELGVAPVDLVHAALFFEHAGLGRALDNAVSLVVPGGNLSVALQRSDGEQPRVTPTAYAAMQTLGERFSLIDATQFRHRLEQRGFRMLLDEHVPLPTGKALWFGVFRAKSNGVSY